MSAVNVPFEIPKGWAWARLGEICEVLDTKRKPITKKDRIPGPYPYYGATCIQDYVAEYIFDEPLVLLGEDGAKWGRGDRSAFCVRGKIWVNNHAHVLRPVEIANHEFLSYTLTILDLAPYITGTTVPKLTQERMSKILLPLPPLAEQRRIVVKIEELFAVVDSLGVAADNLESDAKRLDKKILNLAIRGKLVPQDPSDEPASELVKRIAASHRSPCKNQGEEPIAPLFEIPDSWEWVWLGVISCLISSKKNQILTKEIKQTGKWAVVSQGQNLVDGYSDSNEKVIQDVPIILFGDHTRNVKYLDFPFVVGADGTKLIQSFVDTKWLYYWVLYASSKIRDRGYARHWNELIHIPVPLPPLAEQKRIVAKIEELRAVIKSLTM